MGMKANNAAEIVEAVMRQRKTEKVMCEVGTATQLTEDIVTANRQLVLDAVEAAGWAPFHFPRNVDGQAEPWRAHVLWQEQAQSLARYLKDDLNVESKEPLLTAGCHALVIVTWLPEFYTEAQKQACSIPAEKQLLRDEEHLAASSAMVQNLLLLLTAHDMGSYWSTGGKLRGPEVFEKLGIPTNERFLAGIFIEYPEAQDADKARKPGAQRNARGTGWIREVEI